MLALEISRKYAAHCSVIASRFSLPPFSHPAPIPIKQDVGYERLRIGYVSSDFGNHPLSHLMGYVFGMHNSKNVEVFCYALSPNDDTEWRQRIQSEAEHFLDVPAMIVDTIKHLVSKNKPPPLNTKRVRPLLFNNEEEKILSPQRHGKQKGGDYEELTVGDSKKLEA
ncbi:hypothetical protein KIW84_073740 [Lathyrus oleraceus]|uniref:O-GlcNAc transferase C-terminal domain-containing protein n=1 Tax=Pisum sativum TaxID=3888 RepID=A0A9D4VQV0_PEA|nr:hypothetical protein KIW84_073740 [Pisum sativum]